MKRVKLHDCSGYYNLACDYILVEYWHFNIGFLMINKWPGILNLPNVHDVDWWCIIWLLRYRTHYKANTSRKGNQYVIFRKLLVIDIIARGGGAPKWVYVNYEYKPFLNILYHGQPETCIYISTHLIVPPYRLIYKDWQIYFSQFSVEELPLKALEKCSPENGIFLCHLLLIWLM